MIKNVKIYLLAIERSREIDIGIDIGMDIGLNIGLISECK